MRIGWLHDYRLSERVGGAQLTNAQVIDCAPSWAEIVECYPGDMHECDWYVLNNVKFFPPGELRQATEGGRYIKFEHDYWDTPHRWQEGVVPGLLLGARGVVFLSPLHREQYLRRWRVDLKRTALCPSAIDITPYRMLPDSVRADTVWLGEWQVHKGIDRAVAWAKANGPVHFYGEGPRVPKGPNVHLREWIEPGKVPPMLATFERFLFLPRWHEPFGRTVAEAVMAGCELVVDEERIGACSWGWTHPGEWMAAVADAPVKFWQIVEDWL